MSRAKRDGLKQDTHRSTPSGAYLPRGSEILKTEGRANRRQFMIKVTSVTQKVKILSRERKVNYWPQR